jgi:hypothetical protein
MCGYVDPVANDSFVLATVQIHNSSTFNIFRGSYATLSVYNQLCHLHLVYMIKHLSVGELRAATLRTRA